ncbi:MAG: DoxX family protein [Burkholderiales bacterium]|jgi:putative oxidoreductase|nr:DoxX family protein [Burkholderiales bacterium]
MTANANLDALGKLVLRLSVGVLMLMHGIHKVGAGVDGIVGMVARTGLPGALGYLVYVGEVLAPVLVIIGLWTRPAALLMFVTMIVAVWLVHMGDLLLLTKSGGWALELQGLFLFGSLAIALLGAGRFSLGGSQGRFN